MSTPIIHVNMSGEAAEEELQSFYSWLKGDEDIRQHARVSLQWSPPQEGEMGSALEIIELIISNGFETANLMFAYLAWRHTRREKPKVTFKRGNIEITIASDDEKIIKEVIQSLDEDTE